MPYQHGQQGPPPMLLQNGLPPQANGMVPGAHPGFMGQMGPPYGAPLFLVSPLLNY